MRGATLIAAIAILFAQPAFAQTESNSLKGRWHVDFERSINPYGVRPKSVTLNVIADDGHIFKSEETRIQADGKITKESIEATVNGRFYPVQGSPNSVAVAITRWVPGSVRMEMRAPDGLYGVQLCMLSANLSTMTCDETDTDLRGKKTFAKSVYVRD